MWTSSVIKVNERQKLLLELWNNSCGATISVGCRTLASEYLKAAPETKWGFEADLESNFRGIEFSCIKKLPRPGKPAIFE